MDLNWLGKRWYGFALADIFRKEKGDCISEGAFFGDREERAVLNMLSNSTVHYTTYVLGRCCNNKLNQFFNDRKN